MHSDIQYQKKLCVFYPCTKKEYENGDLTKSISKILDKIPSFSFSFDLFLIFDNVLSSISIENILTSSVNQKCINEVFVHDLKLYPSNNLYIKTWENRTDLPEILPPHGVSSGPNNSFYQSLYYLLSHKNNYEHALLLETDIQILKPLWLDHFIKYCDNNNFTIAGSKYKGIQKWHRVLDYKDHLNGIAIYRLNSDLETLLIHSEQHLINQVSLNKIPFINFDIAIDEWRRSPAGQHFFNDDNKLVDTDFITNASDPEDTHLSQSKILKHYPNTIILHHKTSSDNFSFVSEASDQNYDYIDNNIKNHKLFFSKPGSKINIPLFFHIPKNAGTFTEGLILNLMRHYNRLNFQSENPRELRITIDNKECFNIFFIDTDNLITSSNLFSHIDSITYSIEISNLPKDFFLAINPFSITVNSNGFRKLNKFFDLFDSSFYNFSPFCILRDPLDRALSLYEYNNSHISSHDEKHGLISYENFIEYTSSMQFEDAWLVRNLLDVKDQHEINEEILEKFHSTFKSFKVLSMLNGNLSQNIADIYSPLWDLSPWQIPQLWFKDTPINKNQNNNKKFKISSLTQDQVNKFTEKSKIDYLIFNKYI